MGENEKPQLHPSALEMRCMEAFRRRYIEKEIIPPGVAMVIGTGTHRSVEKNLNNKITCGELLPVEAIRDHAVDGVNSAWNCGVKLNPEEVKKGIKTVKGEALDKAVRLSVLHHEKLAPELTPTHIERPWALELKGYPVDLAGRIDIQEGLISIRDTKTSGKTPADGVASKSLQLKAYSLAIKAYDHEYPDTVWLDYLVDLKIPKHKSYPAKLTVEDYNVLLARVEILSMAMQKEIFLPVEPSHWCCDPKWCGYAETCRYYVNKPKQFAAA